MCHALLCVTLQTAKSTEITTWHLTHKSPNFCYVYIFLQSVSHANIHRSDYSQPPSCLDEHVIILYYIVSHPMSYHIVSYRNVSYPIISYHVILYYMILYCYVMLSYIILYHIISHIILCTSNNMQPRVSTIQHNVFITSPSNSHNLQLPTFFSELVRVLGSSQRY